MAFKHVIDAFHNVHGGTLGTEFYHKDDKHRDNAILLSDAFIRLRETSDIASLVEEVESRWELVETAWTLGLSVKSIKDSTFIEDLTLPDSPSTFDRNQNLLDPFPC